MWRARVGSVSVNDAGLSSSGLPVTGPGSPASWTRRIVALVIDWVLANIVAFAVFGDDVWRPGSGSTWWPLASFFVLVWLSTASTGASPGQWVLGLRIVRLDRRRVGVLQAAVRTLLILLVVPPLIFTKEGRGLHDLAVNTAAVNGPGRTTP